MPRSFGFIRLTSIPSWNPLIYLPPFSTQTQRQSSSRSILGASTACMTLSRDLKYLSLAKYEHRGGISLPASSICVTQFIRLEAQRLMHGLIPHSFSANSPTVRHEFSVLI